MREKLSFAKRIVSAVLTVILILSTVLCFSVVLKTVVSDDVPDLFGYRFFYIVTGSMTPTIQVGETIIVKRQAVYAEGDVIAYIAGTSSAVSGQPITHRIVEVLYAEDGTIRAYVTQGDANTVPDGEISPDAVYGKMVWQSKGEKTANKLLPFLSDRNGFFLILFVPLALLAGIAMADFRAAQKKVLEEKIREAQAHPGENRNDSQTLPGGSRTEAQKNNDKEERP